MNKAIFLDRDGTINVEKHYLYKIKDFEFLPGVVDALNLLQNAGYTLVIITNQSGIARGYYTEDDFRVLNNWMITEFKKQGIEIAGVYYCPHLPDAIVEKYRVDCSCRKPALGLYKQAINELDLDVDHSFAIGDRLRDCCICETTECKGFLINNSEAADVIRAVKAGYYKHISYAEDLKSATKVILEGL